MLASAQPRHVIALVVLTAALVWSQPGPATAAFPGANGKIAFSSSRDGNYEVYAMNADGSGQTRLTSNTGVDAQPAWSPNGTKIAFYSNRDGTSKST